jgi:hypothetical protein
MPHDARALEIADPSRLRDADWAEINKLRNAYETGGAPALQLAYRELGKDPVRYIRVMGALYPDEVRNSIKDALAKRGLTEQDILEAARKRESPTRD